MFVNVVFSLSTYGEVKTISMRISQDNQRTKERRNVLARKRLVQIIEEIKTGKVLILISSFYIIFTLPHTIDQFVYLLDFRKMFFDSIWCSILDFLGGKLSPDYSGMAFVLLTCNYSFNFYFYCLINQDIREIVLKIFKR